MTTKRVTLNLPTTTTDIMEANRIATGMTATDQIRRALGLFNYILDAQTDGKEFRVYEKDGKHRVVEILLP